MTPIYSIYSHAGSDMKNILFVRDSHNEQMGGIEGKVLSIAQYVANNHLFVPLLATSDLN